MLLVAIKEAREAYYASNGGKRNPLDFVATIVAAKHLQVVL